MRRENGGRREMERNGRGIGWGGKIRKIIGKREKR